MRPTTRFKFGGLLLAGVLAALGPTLSLAQTNAPGEYEEMAPGLLSRTLFKGEAGNITVEVIDLLVGPGKSSEPITLRGSALLDVQAGNAVVLIDGKPQSVPPGKVIALTQNQELAIDNAREQRSFVARLVLLSQPGG